MYIGGKFSKYKYATKKFSKNFCGAKGAKNHPFFAPQAKILRILRLNITFYPKSLFVSTYLQISTFLILEVQESICKYCTSKISTNPNPAIIYIYIYINI